MGHFSSVAKVALRFGCAKQLKNLKRYLVYIPPGDSFDEEIRELFPRGNVSYVYKKQLVLRTILLLL